MGQLGSKPKHENGVGIGRFRQAPVIKTGDIENWLARAELQFYPLGNFRRISGYNITTIGPPVFAQVL